MPLTVNPSLIDEGVRNIQAADLITTSVGYASVSSIGLSAPRVMILNNGADYGPDTPGTQTSGIEEAIVFANEYSTAYAPGEVRLLGSFGTVFSVRTTVYLKPFVSLTGTGGVITATASGFTGSYVLSNATTDTISSTRIWGIGVNASNNAIDGCHFFNFTSNMVWINTLLGGANALSAFVLDNSVGSQNCSFNNIWLDSGIVGVWTTGIKLVGRSGGACPDNHFHTTEIHGVSGIGVDVNYFADTNHFDVTRISLSVGTAIGASIGTAGTSATGAQCQRTTFDKLYFDINASYTGYTGIQIGYYQGGNNTILPGIEVHEFFTGGGLEAWRDPVIDIRSVVEGGTGAVADYDIVNCGEGVVMTHTFPVTAGYSQGAELDDPTGDRTAADGSPITLLASAAFNQVYEVDTRLLMTAYNAATGTVTYLFSWTDWAGTPRTMRITGAGLNSRNSGFLRIYVQAASAVTIQCTCNGTWTATTAHARCRMRQQT